MSLFFFPTLSTILTRVWSSQSPNSWISLGFILSEKKKKCKNKFYECFKTSSISLEKGFYGILPILAIPQMIVRIFHDTDFPFLK